MRASIALAAVVLLCLPFGLHAAPASAQETPAHKPVAAHAAHPAVAAHKAPAHASTAATRRKPAAAHAAARPAAPVTHKVVKVKTPTPVAKKHASHKKVAVAKKGTGKKPKPRHSDAAPGTAKQP